MRIVIAPDKFKGSATAAEAAEALAAGIARARPDVEVVELPVADGGDGTVAAALAAGFAARRVVAEGPVGEPVETSFAFLDGTAVIELADVTGLGRLPAGPDGRPLLAPLTASTYGVGQVIRAALDLGAGTIVLGIGGSASTDGGAGMVQALGARLTGPADQELARGGAALAGLTSVDLAGLDARIGATTLLVASDVDNPLLGPSGAAAVFGPQKGAAGPEVAMLDRALARWAGLVAPSLASEPGAGAAGGTGFAAMACLGARLVPGIDLVLDLIGFDAALAGADLVITGEGSLDAQTLGGKAPFGVARAAVRHGVPVVAVAGHVGLTAAELAAAGFARVWALDHIEPERAVSMARAAELLTEVGERIVVSAAGHQLRST